MAWVIFAYLLYFSFVILIGFWTARRASGSLLDYFLGGRRMRDWVVALSAVSSGRSAWLVLGLSGMAYARGVSAVWAVVGYILVELFLFAFLGKRLRRFTEAKRNITLPDFLESRFGSRAVRVLAVVVIFVFLTTYVGAQLLAGGKAFAGSLGVSQTLGLWITALIVLVYTILGGFYAVTITDVVQALFMVLGLVVLPIIAVCDAGGLIQVLGALSPKMLDPWALGFGGVLGLLSIGLGSPGNPHILVRYMSIDDPKALSRSALVGTVWNVVMAWGAIYVGLAGRALVPGGLSDPEKVYPLLAQSHFHPFVFGLVMAAVFAAIMSTVDSQLLVVASGVVRDIYNRFINPEASQRLLVWLSRGVVLLVLGLSVVAGLYGGKVVFWFVLLAWAGLGASFGPVVLLGLYWPRMNKWGALGGMLLGALVTGVWAAIPALKASVYELLPGFLAGLAGAWLFSLIGGNKWAQEESNLRPRD